MAITTKPKRKKLVSCVLQAENRLKITEISDAEAFTTFKTAAARRDMSK